jgi:hypothetical protein
MKAWCGRCGRERFAQNYASCRGLDWVASFRGLRVADWGVEREFFGGEYWFTHRLSLKCPTMCGFRNSVLTAFLLGFRVCTPKVYHGSLAVLYLVLVDS